MKLDLIFCCEILGTIAFSLSGGLLAMQKRLDLFGVFVLSVCTAVGGGVIRDLLLGNTPPLAFVRPVYFACATLSAVVLFFGYYLFRDRFPRKGRSKWLALMNLLDAIGLGVFTVVGVDVCLEERPDASAFLAVFVGVITGVGGGILRDLLADRTPVVLRRDIYACASILGAVVYFYVRRLLPYGWAVSLAVFLIIAVRMLSLAFHLQLPAAGRKRKLIKNEMGNEITGDIERK